MVRIENIKDILIVKLSSIGDICHTSLVLPALKRKNPQAKITWVVEKKFEAVVKHLEEVDEIISFNLNLKSFSNFIEILKTIYKLRKKKYGIAFDFQGLFKSGLLTCICRADEKIGFAPPVSRELSHLFYTTRIRTQIMNIAELNLALINKSLSLNEKLEIPSLKKMKSKKNQSSNSNQLKIGINPYASYYTKALPQQQIIEIAEKIKDIFKVNPILISEENSHDQKKLIRLAPIMLAPVVRLEKLFDLIKDLDFYIGTDTGPSYISQLVKTPSIILFGPTNCNRQLPRVEKSNYFEGIYSDYNCPIIRPEPNFKAYRCQKKKCPNNLCMKQFDSEEIVERIHQFFSNKR